LHSDTFTYSSLLLHALKETARRAIFTDRVNGQATEVGRARPSVSILYLSNQLTLDLDFLQVNGLHLGDVMVA